MPTGLTKADPSRERTIQCPICHLRTIHQTRPLGKGWTGECECQKTDPPLRGQPLTPILGKYSKTR